METNNEHHIKPKILKIIFSVLFIISILFFLIGSFYIPWISLLFIPISFIFFSAFQATSDHLVKITFKCPNCQAPNNFENKKCVKCKFDFKIEEDPNKKILK